MASNEYRVLWTTPDSDPESARADAVGERSDLELRVRSSSGLEDVEIDDVECLVVETTGSNGEAETSRSTGEAKTGNSSAPVKTVLDEAAADGVDLPVLLVGPADVVDGTTGDHEAVTDVVRVDGDTDRTDRLADRATLLADRYRLQRETAAQQERLEVLQERFRFAMEETDVYVWDWNLETDTVERFPKAEPMYGFGRDELQPVFEKYIARVRADHREEVESAYRETIASGGTYTVQYPFRAADGSWVWVEDSGVVFTDDDGEATRAIGVMVDISDLKDRERRLRRQNDLFEKAQDIAKVGAWEYDAGEDELYWTDQLADIFGVAEESASDVDTETVLDFYHPEDRPRIRACFEAALVDAEPYDVEVRIRTADGEQRWVRTRGDPQTEDGEVVRVRGTIQDVTDRKRREHRLRLFRRATEEAGLAILITDRDGTIEYVNPAFEEQTGYAADEAVGENPRILKSGAHEAAFYERMWETITAGEVWRSEVVNQRANGELYTADQTIAPITDEDGTITHFVAIGADVSDDRQRQERLEVLYRAFRHNLRNRIQVFSGAADALDRGSADADAVVETVRDAVDDLEALSRKVTTVRRVLNTEPGTLPWPRIEALLADHVEEARDQYPAVEITLHSSVPESVRADRKLVPVVAEALTNAVRHSGDSPTVDVSVASRDGRLEVTVADDGPGMPDNERAVLERRSETPLDHSQGIGLWMIRWVVDQLGGELDLGDASTPGTTVTISVPARTATETGPATEPDSRAGTD